MSPVEHAGFGDSCGARIKRAGSQGWESRGPIREGWVLHGHMRVVCRDAQLRIKWVDENHNMIPNIALDRILSIVYGTTAKDTLYIGLTDGTPTPAAGDIMGTHAGWVIVSPYSNATDPAAGFAATATGQSIDNSASVATFNINASLTVGGAFVKDQNTVDLDTGQLHAVEAFTGGDRTVANNDTLEVTYTISAADS